MTEVRYRTNERQKVKQKLRIGALILAVTFAVVAAIMGVIIVLAIMAVIGVVQVGLAWWLVMVLALPLIIVAGFVTAYLVDKKESK